MQSGSYRARLIHGSHPVTLDEQGAISIEWPQGVVQYVSAKAALRAIINLNPEGGLREPHTTFDRYFRAGRFALPSPKVDVFDVFQPPPPPPTILIPRGVGVDLVNRGHEVRKLFFAGFGRQVARAGYDPEDVLQEVYQGILIRNEGICPFDPTKSSFGHYVHMICGCVVSNYHRKHSRYTSKEVFGVPTFDGVSLDVAESDIAVDCNTQDKETETLSDIKSIGRKLRRKAERNRLVSAEVAEQIFHMVIKGCKKAEISEVTGVPMNVTSKVLKMIRDVTSEEVR